MHMATSGRPMKEPLVDARPRSRRRLWQLISPALPVGAFAYSQGLEQLIDSGTLADEETVLGWIEAVLEHGLGRLDLPVLLRLHGCAARDDLDRFDAWSRQLVAYRETAELRTEDVNIGTALARLLDALGAAPFRGPLPFAAAFALAAARWSVPADEAAAGYAFNWCENQIAAAVKLGPYGHTCGQRMLLELGGRIDGVVAHAAALGDDDIGLGLPGLAIASARHETQYTRLFRS